MPAINKWGDQVTNEIVRQLLEQGGFYGLDRPIGDMKLVVDTCYLAAMNAPGEASGGAFCWGAGVLLLPHHLQALTGGAVFDICMCAGGGKNDIPNRLKRQFAIFNVPQPSVAAINGIFGKLMEGRFSADLFADAVVQVSCCNMQGPHRTCWRSPRYSAVTGPVSLSHFPGGLRPVGAHDSHALEQDPSQDAAHARQVPLPVQHA